MTIGRNLAKFALCLTLLIGGCDYRSAATKFTYRHGGIIRGDQTRRELALVFTGGDYADGGELIATVLAKHDVKAGFFFTGDFYRNPANAALIRHLVADRHYLGPHSDRHLLYCSWENRDSLLVTRDEFVDDLTANYELLEEFGIPRTAAPFFIPPYEWYNATIVRWAREAGWILINNTPGTLSHADYTIPELVNYRDSQEIWDSIIEFEQDQPGGLNGFLLLIHIGTHPDRTDKFYYHLDALLNYLEQRGYSLERVDKLLAAARTSISPVEKTNSGRQQ
ncbi:MAG: polysaccharide deacetylase family protein [Candidatus Neomarinimicrobiota bacterium]